MDIFRTPVTVPASEKKIGYNSRILFMGSCFSEHIGQKLTESKFNIRNNPFGIVYNPISVARQLEILLGTGKYAPEDLVLHNGFWHSFDHHGSFSVSDQELCLRNINDSLEASQEFLGSADFLFLTFGTAYVYYLKTTGQVVSNCHKLPAGEFDRKLSSVGEITDALQSILNRLFQLNPGLKVVFTVSPVRHWKDGPHANQISKSTLLLAIEEIQKIYPQTFYFPSYEIVMDELRDYRFYDEDMIHPNKVAVDYIWQRFTGCFMEPATIRTLKEVDQVVQASRHRPFHPGDEIFRQFARKNLEKIHELRQKYSISFEKEEEHFGSFLK